MKDEDDSSWGGSDQITNLLNSFHVIPSNKLRAASQVDDYTVIILLTLVGFLALAAILLVPVYRFLRREEKASDKWTAEELARRRREDPPGPNGVDGIERSEQ